MKDNCSLFKIRRFFWLFLFVLGTLWGGAVDCASGALQDDDDVPVKKPLMLPLNLSGLKKEAPSASPAGIDFGVQGNKIQTLQLTAKGSSANEANQRQLESIVADLKKKPGEASDEYISALFCWEQSKWAAQGEFEKIFQEHDWKKFGLEPAGFDAGAVSQLFIYSSEARSQNIKTIFKLEGTTLNRENLSPSAVALGTGIPTFAARLSNRSVASCEIAKMLGVNVLAPAQLKVLKNESEILVGQEIEKVNGEPFKSQEDQQAFVRQHPLQMHQLYAVDFITYQHDRHFNDILVENRASKKPIIKAIDHDFSFGTQTLTGIDPSKNWFHGIPEVLDQATADKIMKLKRASVNEKLKYLLTSAEIASAWERIEQLQNAIRMESVKTGKTEADLIKLLDNVASPSASASPMPDTQKTTTDKQGLGENSASSSGNLSGSPSNAILEGAIRSATPLKPRKLVKQTAANTVPKVINFIWVGKPIPDKYEQNIKRWAELNPTYQFQLWVDSTLLKDHRATPAQESQRFTSHKNIKVIDLVKDPLYQKMNNRRYFEDELSGQAKNYAAASDILRVEILYQYGGIYFDTDTYPTADPLPVAGLLAEHGILIAPFSRSGGLAWSNAVMAAAKKQHAGLKIMSDLISKNYQALYEDPGKLKKHRPIFATDISQQQLQTIEADRDNSVLLTSGPEMVKQAFALDYFPKLSSSVKKDINAVTSGSKDRGTLSPLGPGAVEGWKYAGFVMDARYVDIRSEKSWGLDQARQNQTGK